MIEFPDPLLAVLEILRSEEPGATYGTRPLDTFPDGSNPPLPYVLVAVDAASLSQRVLETVNVRVTVWAESLEASYALARRLRSLLVAYEGGPAVRGFAPLTGPIPTEDPDDGSPMAFLTLAARMRPES